MELDMESDSDSQEHRLALDTKRLKHVFEPYFKRIFSSASFVKHMNQRCSGPNDSTSYILLSEAIKRNDTAAAQALLRHYCKANLGCPDPGKDIPLHLAVLAGNVEIVEMLLNKGARPCVSFQDQRQPLHLICDRASSSVPGEAARIAIAGLLVKHGANVNALEKSRHDSPLYLAVRSKLPGLVRYLLEHGAERHYSNRHSESALHAAFAENAGIDMLELLYDDGFELEQRDANDCTVFSYATRNLMNSGFGSFCSLNEPVRCVLFLLDRGVSVNSVLDKRGNRLLHAICQNHAARSLKIFLERGAEVGPRNADGKTPLHFCAESQPVELVELLLSHGADPKALTNSGQSCLHFAAANKQPGVLELLLGRGLEVDAKGRDGSFTPLFNAVWSDRYENARLLLDWRARVNERIINNQVVLHVAVDQRHARCVELLLERGADLNVLDDYGNTPLTMSLYQVAEASDRSADWWDDGEADESSARPSETVRRALTRHTARLFFMGEWLSEQSLRIMANPHFRDFYAECVAELAAMRDEPAIGGVKLFDVLAKGRPGLLAYARNEEFVAAFRASGYGERYPIYRDELERNVEASLERLELLRASAVSLVRIVQNVDEAWADVHLPSLVVEQVLSYLNLTELRGLAAVYG